MPFRIIQVNLIFAMIKLNRNIVRVAIGIKALILTGVLISIVAIGYDQYSLSSSTFPENNQLAEKKEGVLLYLILFLVPLVLSVIIDFKEQKDAFLKGKWYLITLGLIVFYILLNQLKGHYTALILAGIMIIALSTVLRKQYARN
jgi:hypothetical protein